MSSSSSSSSGVAVVGRNATEDRYNPAEDETYYSSSCDESKCRSVGFLLSEDADADDDGKGDDPEARNHRLRYACAAIKNEPLWCAKGYEGRVITHNNNTTPVGHHSVVEIPEETISGDTAVDPTINTINSNSSSSSDRYHYYTCCPLSYLQASNTSRSNNTATTSSPINTSNADVKDRASVATTATHFRRHCSDPLIALPQSQDDAELTATQMPCNKEIRRKYPRTMYTSIFYPKTYVCCDVELLTAAAETTVTSSRPTTNSSNSSSSTSSGSGSDSNTTGQSDEDHVGTQSAIDDADSSVATSSSVCDESKCLSDASLGADYPYRLYSCWGGGPGTLFPYACIDGYIGRKVRTRRGNEEHDYPISSTFLFDSTTVFSLDYYTCCPPPKNSSRGSVVGGEVEEDPIRHCSDAILSSSSANSTNLTTTTTCGDGSVPINSKLMYKRDMFPVHSLEGITYAFVCCDSPVTGTVQSMRIEDDDQADYNSTNGSTTDTTTHLGTSTFDSESILTTNSSPTTNYLDAAQCVPMCAANNIAFCYYRQNIFGGLFPMTCDYNDAFQYPRITYTQQVDFPVNNDYNMDQNNNDEILSMNFTLYDCCKTQTLNGPFIQDRAFNLTVWPQLVCSFIATVVSAVLVSGLIVSMIKKKGITTNTTYRHRRHNSGNHSNGYNFYLILLAIPDLTLNAFVLVLYGMYVGQRYSVYVPGHVVIAFRKNGFVIPLDTAWIIACSTANVWLNAIVAYEVYTLLSKSHRRVRVVPPTIKKAVLQGAVVYLYAMITFIVHYYVDGNVDSRVLAPTYLTLSIGLPILYLLYVCISIWYRGLLPRPPILTTAAAAATTTTTTRNDEGLRELALYFFRVIIVFFIVWLPALVLLVCSGRVRTRDYHKVYEKDFGNPTWYPIGLLFCSIQPIISTGIALTKTDVREAVWDLRTIPGWFCRCRTKKDSQQHDDVEL